VKARIAALATSSSKQQALAKYDAVRSLEFGRQKAVAVRAPTQEH